MNHSTPHDLATLRHTIRARRRAIHGDERLSKSRAAAANLLARLPAAARHIALFLPLEEEIDTRPLLQALWQRGAHPYLPYTPGKNRALHFLPYQADTPIYPAALGIPAPADNPRARRNGHTLDLIIVPLVAWDNSGNRLGMGGGFYDRTFAQTPRPPLWGFAYDCQQVDALPRAPWDIALDAVVSESRFLTFAPPAP
ncbi:MAG: 5-formyltetrahydrofolate cyclo-ligase [Cardiobacteriaceae bacterium]|nr:5-formyltetrahydrofolate cyclo-ligase [Cardiobacteriaceae bacterium]